MISSYISFPILLTSFILGLLFIFILGPEQKTVISYPTLQNYTKIQYKDSANQCFEFKPVPIICPNNKDYINTVPVQI